MSDIIINRLNADECFYVPLLYEFNVFSTKIVEIFHFITLYSDCITVKYSESYPR